MAIHRIAIKREFCVQQLQIAIGHHHQRVDFQHLDVFFDEHAVQVLDDANALLDLRAFQTQRESHAAAVEIRQTRCRVHGKGNDLFWGVMGDVFDRHAAFG